MISYPEEVWFEIRERWVSGETAGQIAKTPGMPSKVAINKRVKREGWKRLSEQLPMGTSGNTLSVPADLDARKVKALAVLAGGGNYKDAANIVGVDESTLRRWRQDEQYARLCEGAITGLKLEMLDHVRQGAVRDPKHAQWMLEHHPTLRDEFGQGSRNTMIGNTFNVLAHVKTGITRGRVIDVEPEPEDDQSP